MGDAVGIVLGWWGPLSYAGMVAVALGGSLWHDFVRRGPTWNSPFHLFAVLVTFPTALLAMAVNPLKDRTLPFFYTSIVAGGLVNVCALAVAARLLLAAFG